MVAIMLRKLLWLYKQTISLILGNRCRFYPPCSDYMVEAIESHGLLKGGLLGMKRLCKCNPLHAGGFDYVPPPLSHKPVKGKPLNQILSQSDVRQIHDAKRDGR